MTVVEGNLVDIHRRKIYPAKIYLKRGRIYEIEEVEDSYNTYIIPPFVDASVNLEDIFLNPVEFGKVALRCGVVGGVFNVPNIQQEYGLKGMKWLSTQDTPLIYHWSVHPDLKKRDIVSLLNSDLTSSFGCIKEGRLNRPIKYGVVLAKSLDKGVVGCVDGITPKGIYSMLKKGVGLFLGSMRDSVLKEVIKKDIVVGFNRGSSYVNSHSSKSVFSSYGLNVSDIVSSYIDSWVRDCIDRGYDIFRVLRVASLNPVKFFNLDIGLLREGDRGDFLIVDSIKDLNIERVFVNGKVVVDNGVYYKRDRKLKIPKGLDSDRCLSVGEGSLSVKFKLPVMGYLSEKGYMEVIDNYERFEIAKNLVLKDI